MVRSSLYIWTIDPRRTSLHNQVIPLANYARLQILLIFFRSVVFSTPRALLIYFHMQFLNAQISWPHWLQTLLFLTSLIRFGWSSSMILSWRGTGNMHIVNMLTKIWWWMTLVTSWSIKENCAYHRVLLKPSYKNIMIHIVISARHLYIIDDIRVILLDTDDSWHLQIPQGLWYVSSF